MTAGTGGLLAVHAHPDDETLSTGALLATWARAGRPVTVVTCTRGERGEVIPPDLAHLASDPAALAAHRETELAGALAALGVVDHLFLDDPSLDEPALDHTSGNQADAAGPAARYEDSGMVWVGPAQAGPGSTSPRAFVRVPVADAAARLAPGVPARRPALVGGYGPGGGDRDPDHVHAHTVMRAAVAAAAEADPDTGLTGHRVTVVLWAALDEVALRSARSELRDVAAPDLLPERPDAPTPSAAVLPDEVSVRVDVAPVLARVTGALAAHATQVYGIRTWRDRSASLGCFALSNRVLQPILTYESYVTDPTWRSGRIAWPVHVSTGIA